MSLSSVPRSQLCCRSLVYTLLEPTESGFRKHCNHQSDYSHTIMIIVCINIMHCRSMQVYMHNIRFYTCTVKTRVFGKLFKIYTWALKGVIVTFRSNVSIVTKALHPGSVELKPLYKHPPYTLIFTVYKLQCLYNNIIQYIPIGIFLICRKDYSYLIDVCP